MVDQVLAIPKLKTSGSDMLKAHSRDVQINVSAACSSSCATGAPASPGGHKPASCDADEGSQSARGGSRMLIYGCLAGDVGSLRGISLKQQQNSGIVYYRKLPNIHPGACVRACVRG